MRIFISYRRDDSAGYAGRLYDRLATHFGADNIFMDIDTLRPGQNFVRVIEEAVDSCDALVALIGKQWLTITDKEGLRRLDNPHDYVRLEIQTALDRDILVIPALVRDAAMPRSTTLPDELAPLAQRHALQLSDTRFHDDVDVLIQTIEQGVRKASSDAASPRKFTIRRWWRVVALLLALGLLVLDLILIGSIDQSTIAIVSVPVAIITAEHLLRRRWRRGILNLVWLAVIAVTWLSYSDEGLIASAAAIAAIVLTPVALIWATTDAASN